MRLAALLPASLLTVVLAGCVVAPLPPPRAVYGPPPGAMYGPPPGVVYVAPTYAVPAPGFVWSYHAQYGWGYHHPQYGWHRGWR